MDLAPGLQTLEKEFIMSDKTLRYIIASVIALLLVFQIGSLISGLFGMAWGAFSAVLVGAVSFFSSRLAKAGGKRSFWFLLPTLLFTVFPVVFMAWKSLTSDTGGFDRLVTLMPFIVGFVLPVLLLLVVYYELRKRTGLDQA
jgi:Na+/proline symporter